MLSKNGEGINSNDANGNTLTGGGRTNTWDSQNRMVQCVYNGTTSNFTYGADGLRHKMLVTNSDGSQTQTQYVYDGQNLVADITQNRLNSGAAWSNPLTNTYLMGASGPMYRKPGGSADVRWYVSDGLGSVVGEVDVNGNVTSSTKRDVYGLTRSGSGAATSRQGFVGQSCGHMTDPETGGLVYMRARYYDPGVGRFANEDPKCDGVNWYVYCSCDPVNRVDFTGNEGNFFTWLGKDLMEKFTLDAFCDWLFHIGLLIIAAGGHQCLQGWLLLRSSQALDAASGGDGLIGMPLAMTAQLAAKLGQMVGGLMVKQGVSMMLTGIFVSFGSEILKFGGEEFFDSVFKTITQQG